MAISLPKTRGRLIIQVRDSPMIEFSEQAEKYSRDGHRLALLAARRAQMAANSRSSREEVEIRVTPAASELLDRIILLQVELRQYISRVQSNVSMMDHDYRDLKRIVYHLFLAKNSLVKIFKAEYKKHPRAPELLATLFGVVPTFENYRSIVAAYSWDPAMAQGLEKLFEQEAQLQDEVRR